MKMGVTIKDKEIKSYSEELESRKNEYSVLWEELAHERKEKVRIGEKEEEKVKELKLANEQL